MRQFDRKLHGIKGFPNLHFPEIYVIAGGYRAFHQKYPELCTPHNYISMEDPLFADSCRDAQVKLRRDLKEFKSKMSSNISSSVSNATISAYAPTPTSRRAPLLYSTTEKSIEIN